MQFRGRKRERKLDRKGRVLSRRKEGSKNNHGLFCIPCFCVTSLQGPLFKLRLRSGKIEIPKKERKKGWFFK